MQFWPCPMSVAFVPFSELYMYIHVYTVGFLAKLADPTMGHLQLPELKMTNAWGVWGGVGHTCTWN